MSFNANGRIEVMIRIDGQNNAGGAVTQADGQLKQLENTAQRAAGAININVAQGKQSFLGLGDGIGAAIGKAGLFVAAAEKVVGVVKDIGAFAEEAAIKADRFDALKASVAGFEGILQRAKQASRGMIPEAELTKAISLFSAFGLPLEQFDRTLQQVIKTSIRTGEGVNEMLDSMVRGIARESPMILDNLGIIVKMGDVTEQAAKAHGKLAEELTATERKAAILGAALSDLERQNINVDMTNARTASISRLKAGWEDLKDAVGGFLADAAVGVIDFFGNLFDTTSKTERRIQEMTDRLPASFASLRQAAEVEIGAVESAFRNAADAAVYLKRTFNDVYGSTKTEQDDFASRVEKIRKEEQDAYDARVAGARKKLEGAYTAYGKMTAEAELKSASEEGARVRDANISKRIDDLAKAWDQEVTNRKITDKKLEDENKQHAENMKRVDDEKRSRMDPAVAAKEESEAKLKTLTEARDKAEKARNVDELKRIDSEILGTRKLIDEYDKAIEHDRNRPRGARAPKPDKADDRFQLPDIPGPYKVRMAPDYKKDDYAGQAEFAERKAKAEIDALQSYQASIMAAMQLPGIDDKSIGQLAERYEATAERIKDIEFELQLERMRIAGEAEDAIAKKREDQAKRAEDTAKKKKAMDLENASNAIKFADVVLSTFIKNDKALALARIPLALAEAGLAAARQDYFGMAMGLWSAVQYGIVAGTGGGGKGGAQGSRGSNQTALPSERKLGQQGNTTINLYGGVIFGTPQEIGYQMAATVRSAQGTGMQSGAV